MNCSIRQLICLSSLLPCLAVAQQSPIPSRMGLEQAIRFSLERNLDLETEEFTRQLREKEILLAKREFAWTVAASYLYQYVDKPQNTREFIATGGEDQGFSPRIFEERNHQARFGLSKKLKSGTEVELGTRYSVLDNTLNRSIPPSLFSPEYEAFTGLTLTQPLWRGFGREVNEAEIKAAMAAEEAAGILVQVRAMTVVAETASRYYDLVSAWQNKAVKTEGHHLAAKLLDRSRRLEESGKATTADVLKAEVALYQRQEEEIEAESIKIDRQNALLLLMADDVAAAERSILPTTGLTTDYHLPDRGNLVGNAVENRLDVVYYRKLLERAGHNLIRGKDAAKPQINLVATAGVNGLAGDGNGSYSESFGGQGPEFSIGLNFAMPLNGKMRRAEWDMAELELKKAETSLRKQKATVALEIDTALSRVRSLLQRVSTAAKAREMAARNMESEEKLLEEGRSDNFRVLEMQQEYADVCSRQIEAQAELNKSMVGLWLASGQIFEKFSIQFPLATTKP